MRRGVGRALSRSAVGGLAALMVVTGAAGASAATVKEGYPFKAGDSFTYTYVGTNAVQAGCTGTPAVSTQTYTEVTTIQPPTNYTVPPGIAVTAYPFQTTATTTTSNGTLTVNNVDYRNFVTNGDTTDFVDYGFVHSTTTTMPQNVTEYDTNSRTYLTPFLRDQFPRAPQTTLPLPVAFNHVVNDYVVAPTNTANVLQSNQTRQVDGSYTESGMTYDVPYAIVQNADSTGTGTEGPADAPETWSFSLPETRHSHEVIPVVATYGGASGTNFVPDWFPGHGAPPNPLASSAFVDEGLKKVPANCGIYAGKRATLLHETYTDLGAVAGNLYSETDDYYVVDRVGRVCMDVTTTTKVYDQEVTGECETATTVHTLEGLVSETLR